MVGVDWDWRDGRVGGMRVALDVDVVLVVGY